MTGTKVVVSLNCGRCTHCESDHQEGRKGYICTLFDVRVMSYFPFCVEFEMGGMRLPELVATNGVDTGNNFSVVSRALRSN